MLDKTYTPRDIEQKHYQAAEAADAFACHPDSGKTPYTIMMPPPNVTGSLHMGHALTFTIQDILIRYYRRAGRDALWMPGTDHAGIATQMVVERQLAEQKISRHDLGREKFLEKVWQWKEESGGAITRQLRALGASPDWKRERFTMDEGLSHAVRKVFVELYNQKLIYRDKRLVNWDPKLQTAISDLEVEQRPIKGKLYYLKYAVDGGSEIIVATTRPETIFADEAIAVHPDNDKWKHLIGKSATIPLTAKKIPVIADDYADPEKGSGAVKITPGHDFNDFNVGKKHNLPQTNIFDREAKLIEAGAVPKDYVGLEAQKARVKIVAELEEKLFLDKIEDNAMVVPHGDRSGVVIEPFLTDQWYCDAVTLAKPALEAVRNGKIKFVPEKWSNTYYNWLENIQPWCISRQLWWGHQIPAWYGPDGKYFVAMDESEAAAQAKKHYGKDAKLTRDEDVLDTWFSSALWPFSTLGWENGGNAFADWNQMKRYYPTDVLVTGFDIIFFWVARMIMMGLHFQKDVPFREVYIHALVRDAKGQKMSKTKGNVIDPLTVAEEYGCDALRFTLAALSVPGRDIKMSPERVAGYRSFATKLWNAARFCEMNGCVFDPKFDPAAAKEPVNRWIVGEIAALEKSFSQAMRDYRFDEAANAVYHTAWGSFCDWYLEFTKPILAGTDAVAIAETKAATAWALAQLLHILNPIMPFITEEIARQLNLNNDDALITTAWPQYKTGADEKSAREIGWLIDLIGGIRAVRAELNIAPSAQLNLLMKDVSNMGADLTKRYRDVILRMARLKEITAHSGDIPAGAIVSVIDGATLILPVADVVDLSAERARLQKEVKKLEEEIARCDAKLNNDKFIANAAEEAIDEVREKRKEADEARGKLRQALDRIAG